MLKRKQSWLMISLYVNSVALGVILMWVFSPAPEPDDNTDEPAVVEKDSVPDVQTILDGDDEDLLPLKYTIQNGDREFQMGEFERAIQQYRGVIQKNDRTDAVVYRIGLALEASRRFAKANEIYSALLRTSKRPYFLRASRLALARIDMKTGGASIGREMLWKLLLERPGKDSQDKTDPGFVGEASHLLSISYASRILRPQSTVSVDINTPVHAEVQFDPQFFLTDLLECVGETDPLESLHGSSKPAAKLPDDVLVQPSRHLTALNPGQLEVERIGEAFNLSGQLVKVHAQRVGLKELFAALEKKLELTIEFTPSAIAEINVRSVDLSVDQIDLATLLYGLISPLNLYWLETDEKLRIAARSDLTSPKIDTLDYRMAVHLLRFSIFDFPENRLLGATQFVFGNLSFQQRVWPTAIASYREAVQNRYLSEEIRQKASFNLGKAFFQTGQLDDAETAFFYAVDATFEGDLAGAGLLIIARQHLIDGKYETAVKHASRAIKASNSLDFKEMGSILMASGYLLNKQFFAANQAIMDNRTSFVSQRRIEIATFLSAYARYFASSVHGNEEPEDLLRTLGLVPKNDPDFPQLVLFLGKAQRALGFHREAVLDLIGVYAVMPESNLQREYHDEIALGLVEAGPFSDAAIEYEKLLSSDAIDSRSTAQLMRTAQIEFDNGNYESCKQVCEKILSRTTLPEFEKKALRLIAQSYQRTQDYHTAATYFAGIYQRPQSKKPSNEERQ